MLVIQLGAVVAVRPDGSSEQVLIGAELNAWRATWSPDGRNIAFNGDNHSVTIFDLEDRTAETIAYGAELGGWSPDGAQIVVSDLGEEYYSEELQTWKRPHVGLSLINVATGDRQLLTSGAYMYHSSPSFEPSGAGVVFHEQTWDYGGDIFRVNLDSSGLELLGPGDNPRVSPDGTKMLYSIDAREGGSGIGIMDSDGTRSEGGVPGGGAVWSPDGRSFAFSRYDEDTGMTKVWILDLAQGSAVGPRPTGLVAFVSDWGVSSLVEPQTTKLVP